MEENTSSDDAAFPGRVDSSTALLACYAIKTTVCPVFHQAGMLRVALVGARAVQSNSRFVLT
eukprot:398706-Amphidinium_carterae.1